MTSDTQEHFAQLLANVHKPLKELSDYLQLAINNPSTHHIGRLSQTAMQECDQLASLLDLVCMDLDTLTTQ